MVLQMVNTLQLKTDSPVALCDIKNPQQVNSFFKLFLMCTIYKIKCYDFSVNTVTLEQINVVERRD